MTLKDAIARKLYNRAYRDRTRDRRNADRAARRAMGLLGPTETRLKAWLVAAKSGPCMDCGGKFPPCAMDFDHRPGTVKVCGVGSMLAMCHDMVRLQEEVDKCDLVCANCHRVRTQSRRKSGRRTP